MKKTISAIISLSLIFFIAGCKNNTVQFSDINSIELTPSEGNLSDLNNNSQKWHITNKRICVVFGYDFNKPEITNELLSLLQDNFGLDSDGGLIYPLIYPNDFRHGTRGYATDLLNELQAEDKDFMGVVILGAPDNTHSALARNQDKWNREVPYPVIALFPQDEVLGIESTCDIVLDKSQTANMAGEITQEEIEGQLIAEAPEVLINTIKYIQNLSYSLPIDSKLQSHVLQMVKSNNIHHYTDPETGLQSINHFVLK